jgi:leucyl/phenylalanyl-tRNA--protein transferase
MPIYKLPEDYLFPDPELATASGLLAFGGDLSPGRLEAAYRAGIFPWYDESSPDIMWWSPSPRMVLYPDNFKLSKSLRRRIKRQEFELRIDTAFEQVIEECSRVPRNDQEGTWLTEEMKAAYVTMHHQGLAHSVECWQEGQLVGGLYGLSLGRLFFGESMFHLVSDASKVAFYHLSELSKNLDFSFIDCQMHTDHLESLGAEEMARSTYLQQVASNNKEKTNVGKWTNQV